MHSHGFRDQCIQMRELLEALHISNMMQGHKLVQHKCLMIGIESKLVE